MGERLAGGEAVAVLADRPAEQGGETNHRPARRHEEFVHRVKPIVMALMGGLGSPFGVVCGALLYLGLEEVVWRNYIQSHSGVLGVLIVSLLLFLPHGLTSLRTSMFWRKAKHV